MSDERRDCAVCATEIEPLDQVLAKTMPNGPHPDAVNPVETTGLEQGYWIHVACSSDGVTRWCRAGRPNDGPLSWIRENGLNWTGLQGHGVRGRMVLD